MLPSTLHISLANCITRIMTDTLDKPPDIDDSFYSEKPKILSDDLPPLEVVRAMIKYETELRLSKPIQDLFDLYHTDDNSVT